MRLALAAVLGALLLAGCGGNDTTAASAAAAGLAPADAKAYVELDTSLDSDQWKQAQALLDRFPKRPQLVEKLNEQLRDHQLEWERDVDPALGDQLVLLWLGKTPADAVVLTQADDQAKFQALVRKVADGKPVVVGNVEGWSAAAERQSAIDALAASGGSLADDDAFSTALAKLPAERLGFGWARGDALPADAPKLKFAWFAGALEARDDGTAATIVTSVSEGSAGAAYESKLVDLAPADALAFLSFDGSSLRANTAALGDLPGVLGGPVKELLAQVRGEGALWVRPGLGMPQVTLVAEVEDPGAAGTALRELLAQVPLGVKVGVVDGKLVATSASSPEAALQAGGDHLGGSADFQEAAKVAGMPDKTTGFLFVNVADALPLLSLAGLAGADVPKELIENLRPVRSVVAWGEPEGSTSTNTIFVHVE
ncbi:MAG TPA: hypothetical protein VFP31_13755 [Gaiellaceae bacterium]|nr:hypothetical protein [Gaiellaceae bacterium]